MRAFGISIDRQHSQVIHCAFEMEEDADRFARAMKARLVDDYAG